MNLHYSKCFQQTNRTQRKSETPGKHQIDPRVRKEVSRYDMTNITFCNPVSNPLFFEMYP